MSFNTGGPTVTIGTSINVKIILRIARNLDSAAKLPGCKPGDDIIIKK